MGKKNKQKKKAPQKEMLQESIEENVNDSIPLEEEEENRETDQMAVTNDEDEDDGEYEAEVRAYRDVLLEKGKLPITDEEEETPVQEESNKASALALQQRLEEIKPNLPFMETLTITSTSPLPFSSTKDLVHDDLKREVIFYNTALEATKLAKTQFLEQNVPFARPQDFYAEMVKTDDHMRKVKDRLLFEGKKIAAFEQRKMNKETKLRSKENKNKAQELKNKDKREHFDALKNWERDGKRRRGDGTDNDDDDENRFKRYFNEDGKNPRRIALDRKYGHGGPAKKKGHFKQTDKKALNDYSDFKKNNKRPGKRAREAKRQRKN